MDYQQKYLKYKHKYLQLKKQMSGGSLEFVNNGQQTYKLMKQVREPCGNDQCVVRVPCNSTSCIVYEELETKAIQFTINEKMAIDDFATNIMPLFLLNGQPLQLSTQYTVHQVPPANTILLPERIPQTITTDATVLGAGNFGAVFSADRLVIKIAKIYNAERLATEIRVNQQVPQHPNINKFYGWITSSVDLQSILQMRHVKPYVFNMINGLALPVQLPSVNTSETLVFMIFEKADEETLPYLISMLPDFPISDCANDIIAGIKHLHANNILHNDIKLDNTMVFRNPLRYQIIDMGGAQFVHPNTIVRDTMGIGAYITYIGSVFDNSPQYLSKSMYYDWHCLYLSLLALFDCIIKVNDILVINGPNVPVNAHTHIGNDMIDGELFTTWLHDYLVASVPVISNRDRMIAIIEVLSHAQEMHKNSVAVISGARVSNLAEYEGLL